MKKKNDQKTVKTVYVTNVPIPRGQHEDTKIAVLGPRGRGHEDEDPMPARKMSISLSVM